MNTFAGNRGCYTKHYRIIEKFFCLFRAKKYFVVQKHSAVTELSRVPVLHSEGKLGVRER